MYTFTCLFIYIYLIQVLHPAEEYFTHSPALLWEKIHDLVQRIILRQTANGNSENSATRNYLLVGLFCWGRLLSVQNLGNISVPFLLHSGVIKHVSYDALPSIRGYCIPSMFAYKVVEVSISYRSSGATFILVDIHSKGHQREEAHLMKWLL